MQYWCARVGEIYHIQCQIGEDSPVLGWRGGSHISKRSLSQSRDRMVDVSGAMGRTWVCREEEGDKKRELSVEL